ncbi:MAG: septum formation initiator family protein [Deltaproteobacteria bacterium]|nr:septum formation initiator family protein [Deltaproteobacteria bacterium]
MEEAAAQFPPNHLLATGGSCVRILEMILTLFKFWLGFAILVLVTGLVRGDSGIRDYFSLRDSRDRLADTVEKLKKETEAIEEEIHKIKSSQSYAKKVFKDKYHVTEDGERIMFFAD